MSTPDRERLFEWRVRVTLTLTLTLTMDVCQERRAHLLARDVREVGPLGTVRLEHVQVAQAPTVRGPYPSTVRVRIRVRVREALTSAGLGLGLGRL